METKYERARVEIIEFESNDVITTSDPENTTELPMEPFTGTNG